MLMCNHNGWKDLKKGPLLMRRLSEDSGIGHTGERLSSLAMVLLLAMPAASLFWDGMPEGSVWSAALDISVVGITSHVNGSTHSDVPQSIKVRMKNSGSEPFTSNVILNLSVWSSTSLPSLVFSNQTDIGTVLSTAGSQTNHTFPDWTPTSAGVYTLNVTVLNTDDDMSNNSVGIEINIVAGSPYKFSLTNLGPSTQAIEKGKSTLDNGNPYIFKLVNRGALQDRYNITIQSAWAMKPYPTTIKTVLPGNESNPVAINVKVPVDVDPFDWDTLVVSVTSNGDHNVSQVITFNTTVAKNWGVKVDAAPPVQKGYPGGPWINFTFMVTNIGNFADSYSLTALPNPVNWTAKLWTSEYTNTLSPGEPTTVYAGIRIPELDYDLMEELNTKRGNLGWLTLQANSRNSDAQGSAEGIVEVGLVHTVQMRIDPMNATVPWYDSKEIRTVTFNLSIRSVSNDYGVTPPKMVINLSAPKGPNGVEFTPIWSFAPNKTESKRWGIGFNSRNISLEPGKWSQYTQFKIYYPTFPICGTAAAQIKATPRINSTFDGMTIAKRDTVMVHVEGMRDFTLDAPKWEYLNSSGPPPDKDGNGYPDWKEGAPGEVLSLPFNITNTGNVWDSYTGTGFTTPLEGAVKLPDDWKLDYPDGRSVGPLLPKNFDPRSSMYSDLLDLKVTVPRGAPIGERVNITLVVSSQSDNSLTRKASIEIRVKQGYGLDLEPENTDLSAVPDQTVRCALNLTNTGNGLDIARIQYASAGITGWRVDFNSTTIELMPDSGTTFDVFITPSIDASADQVLTIRMRAVSVKMPTIEDSVVINVTVKYLGGVTIEPLSPDDIWRYPGEAAPFQVGLRNTGNGNDTFDLSIANVTEGWTYTISSGGGAGPSSAYIPRGDTALIWINISIPSMDQASDATDIERLGIHAMNKVASTLSVTPRGDPASAAGATLSIGILQLFDAGLGLVTGERSHKSVLVGEDAVFRMYMQNRGNGEDLISSGLQGSARHMGWSYVDTESSYLSPFEYRFFNVTVTPNPFETPLYDESIPLNVRCFAGDEMSYRSIGITVDVAMSRLGSENVDVDLGSTGLMDLLICNMPDPGTDPYPEFPLQRNYSVWTRLDTDGVFSEGWQLIDNTTEVLMTELYEIRHVWIRLRAPSDLITGSPYSRVLLGVYGGPGKSEEMSALARAVFFDCSIDVGSTGFFNLYEGGKGQASIKLIATGNRPQIEIPIKVTLDGTTIGTFIAGPAHPENYSQWGEPLQMEVFFDLPTLGWYEKGKELDIEIVVDPENAIVENTQDGRALSESNNYMLKTFTINNYSPEWPIFIGLALLFVVASIAGIVGYVMHDRRNSYYLLPLACGLSGILALVFYLPLEKGWDLSFANAFGLGIILLDLIVILPIMVYLFTRAGNAYILNILKERSSIGASIEMETIRSPLVPFLISFVGGLLLSIVPIAIWVLPAHIRDEGATGILKALIDDTGIMPVWAIVLFAVMLSVAAQFVLLALKRQSMKYVLSVSDKLEKLNREIEEELV
jgi:uncharacterized membrane protein